MAQTLFMNRRGTEPYARWCERTGEATPLPTRLFKAYDGEFGRLQTSQLIRLGGQALLLSALLMAGVLTGCGDSEAPTTDSKVPTDEPQEPMDTGPMANDGQATRESTGDGVSDPE